MSKSKQYKDLRIKDKPSFKKPPKKEGRINKQQLKKNKQLNYNLKYHNQDVTNIKQQSSLNKQKYLNPISLDTNKLGKNQKQNKVNLGESEFNIEEDQSFEINSDMNSQDDIEINSDLEQDSLEYNKESEDESEMRTEEEEKDKEDGAEEQDDVFVDELQIQKQQREQLEQQRIQGQAVMDQEKFGNKVLELKILLQKIMQESLKMPRSYAQHSVKESDKELSQCYDQYSLGLKGLLADMQDIFNTEMIQQTSQKQRTDIKFKNDADQILQRDSEQCWRHIDKQYQQFRDFGDPLVDSYHQRLIAQQGGNYNSLKALNQPISQQVQMLLVDEQRAIKRAHLRVQDVPQILCQFQPQDFDQTLYDQIYSTVGKQAQEDEEVDPYDAVQEKQRYDFETYDDTELHKQMLKSFLESLGTQGPSMYSNKLQSKKSQRQQKDRRASKGRKIRYVVQEKLQGFMAPQTQTLQPMYEHMLKNLFGMKQ